MRNRRIYIGTGLTLIGCVLAYVASGGKPIISALAEFPWYVLISVDLALIVGIGLLIRVPWKR